MDRKTLMYGGSPQAQGLRIPSPEEQIHIKNLIRKAEGLKICRDCDGWGTILDPIFRQRLRCLSCGGDGGSVV